jgi:uncharacterized protein (DUF39 family)
MGTVPSSDHPPQPPRGNLKLLPKYFHSLKSGKRKRKYYKSVPIPVPVYESTRMSNHFPHTPSIPNPVIRCSKQKADKSKADKSQVKQKPDGSSPEESSKPKADESEADKRSKPKANESEADNNNSDKNCLHEDPHRGWTLRFYPWTAAIRFLFCHKVPLNHTTQSAYSLPTQENTKI